MGRRCRNLIIGLLLVIFPLPCLADLGTLYSVHATIITATSSYNGYFFLVNDGGFYFQKDSAGYAYQVRDRSGRLLSIKEKNNGRVLVFGPDQKDFAAGLISFLKDTISLYPTVHYVYFEEDGSDVAIMAGPARKIARNDIKRVTVQSFHECSILYRSATPLESPDTWVTGKVYKVENLGQVECSYYALYFSMPVTSTEAMVKEFQKVTRAREELRNGSEDEHKHDQELQLKAKELIRLLKQKRVIILFTCSC